MWTDVSVLSLPFEKKGKSKLWSFGCKKNKKVGGRDVCFASVMPISNSTIYDVSIITIKKYEEDKI